MRMDSRMIKHKTKKVVDNTNKVEDKIAEVDGHKKSTRYVEVEILVVDDTWMAGQYQRGI